jgi:hypothetical protein
MRLYRAARELGTTLMGIAKTPVSSAFPKSRDQPREARRKLIRHGTLHIIACARWPGRRGIARSYRRSLSEKADFFAAL